MDETGIPFILDDRGDVWAFKRPYTLEDPIKLPNLNHITQLVPYGALTKDGKLYVWGLGPDTRWHDDSNDIDARYTDPAIVQDLRDITYIASTSSHFVAIQKNQNVYEWNLPYYENISGKLLLRDQFSRPKYVFSHPDIISAATDDFITTVLTHDNTVFGWKLAERPFSTEPTPSVMGAIWTIKLDWESSSLYLTNNHLIVLTKSGDVRFWGDCKFSAGWASAPATGGSLLGIADIAGVGALLYGDNIFADAFLRRDGTVWFGHPAMPHGTSADCLSKFVPRIPAEELVQIVGMDVPATSVAAAGDGVRNNYTVIVIGEDHSLWGANSRQPKPRFYRLPFSLPQD